MATIMMPVTALNEDCIKCPELDIQTDQLAYFSQADCDVRMEQVLCCSHWKRCTAIYNRVKKDWEENHVTKLSKSIPSDPFDPLGRE